MHFKYMKTAILLIGIFLVVFVTPSSMAATIEKDNTFQSQFGILNQKLYVSVPPSLCNYYSSMSHTVYDDSDYANFVTPQAVASIAASIQSITDNMSYPDEQFADAVLGLVHQMSYVVNGPQYPVETLVSDSGDCVALSLLAASIMQAGGLDVILIHYIGISPGHMNVGVYLPYTPIYHTAGESPTDFVYDNKTYWTAECTPAENWKVGDQWSALTNVESTIIPLNATDQSSPAQVSSRLNAPFTPSSITINLSQSNITQNTQSLTISGAISPAFSGGNVTIYVNNEFDSELSNEYFTTVTDDSGGYMFDWSFSSAGTYNITASWDGNSNSSGADSETLMVFAGPESIVEFNGVDYSYIYGEAGLPPEYQISPLIGVDNFMSIPLGTNVSVSYNFIVLQAGETISNVQSETETLPGNTYTITRIKGVTPQIYQQPSQTVTVPVNVPSDLQLLMLPSNFNQTINNQFSFIIQNNVGSYSLNVSALNGYEVSSVTQGGSGNVAFLNASADIKPNTWYNFIATLSGYGVSANVYDPNGTVIDCLQNTNDWTASNETVMLIANNVDNVVVFKDLTIQALDIPTLPLASNTETAHVEKSMFPTVSLSILLAATLSVTLVFISKKRRLRQRTKLVSAA